MRIFLTKRAERNYQLIKDYITKEWGEIVAEAFEQKTIDFLDLLEDFSEIGQVQGARKKDSWFPTHQADKNFLLNQGRVNYNPDFL